MEKEIRIDYDDGPMEAQEIVEHILKDLNVQYEIIEHDSTVFIKYQIPSNKKG